VPALPLRVQVPELREPDSLQVPRDQLQERRLERPAGVRQAPPEASEPAPLGPQSRPRPTARTGKMPVKHREIESYALSTLII